MPGRESGERAVEVEQQVHVHAPSNTLRHSSRPTVAKKTYSATTLRYVRGVCGAAFSFPGQSLYRSSSGSTRRTRTDRASVAPIGDLDEFFGGCIHDIPISAPLPAGAIWVWDRSLAATPNTRQSAASMVTTALDLETYRHGISIAQPKVMRRASRDCTAQSWQKTYRGMMPDEFAAGRCRHPQPPCRLARAAA